MQSLPPVRDLIEALVVRSSISSISPQWDQSNQAVAALLAQWFEDLGFACELLEVAEHPGKFNLVATRGSGAGGLVLSGHTDTVPFDEHGWSRDPLRLSESDHRLYGLGTADMKSFFALVVEALRGLDLNRLQAPLTILATADEESSMCGAKALVERGVLPGRHAIIGEPTGLKPIRMHKGISMEVIRLHGRSGHSSDPALGVNALEGMHRVIGEILQWRTELQARYRNPLFEVDVPTLNLGHICGGDNPNRICGSCELQFDLRPLPGMELDALRGELQDRLGRLLQDSELRLEMYSGFAGIPPMETPAEAEIVQALEAMTGQPAGSVAFGTEGPFLQRLGLETVILGPGHIDQAHQPDEFLALDQIDPMVEILRGAVRHFCLA